MNDKVFKSGLSHIICLFIQAKRTNDLPYSSGEKILIKFDRMIAESFPHAVTITKEIVDAWISHNTHLHINTQIRMITPVRQLCRFMQSAGIDTYICPEHEPGRSIRYQPHLITEQELKAFFTELDRKSMKNKKNIALRLTLPVSFRLLYACGIRSGELIRLTCDDVNLDSGKLTIRKSKAHGMRIVMMSNDMTEVMRCYNSRISLLYRDRKYFFHGFTSKNGRLDQQKMQYHLNTIISRIPEFKNSAPPKMRVHDFRHLFALSCIRKWVKEKKELNALYPYLSTYMGHSSFEATDYYLHLSEECQTDISEAMKDVNDFLFGRG